MEKSSTTDQRLQTMALYHSRVIVIRHIMISKITVTIAATIALLLAINTFGIKVVQAHQQQSTANDHCDINCRLKMVESKLDKAYPLSHIRCGCR
jgi:hypothetical protein